MDDWENDCMTLGLLSFLFWNYSSIPTLKTCNKTYLVIVHYFKRDTIKVIQWWHVGVKTGSIFIWLFIDLRSMLLAQGGESTMNQIKCINQDTKAQFNVRSLPGRLNECLYSIPLSCFTGRCLCVSFSLYLASDKKICIWTLCCKRMPNNFLCTC